MDPTLSTKPWSPSPRPTVNTSFQNLTGLSTPSELSPHTGSMPTSSQSSPWSQNAALASGQPPHYLMSHSRSAIHPDPSDPSNIQPFSNNEWSHLFSAPLNPTVFAALAANGVLGSMAPGTPSSLPASSYHGHYNPNVMGQSESSHRSAGSWSQAPSSYTPTSTYHHKPPSLPRSSSSSNVAPRSKGKDSIRHLQDIRPRPIDTSSMQGRPSGDGARLPASLRRHDGRKTLPIPSHIHTSSGGGRYDSESHTGLLSRSPVDYTSGHAYPTDRSAVGLPPSLWMSPASANSNNSIPYDTPNLTFSPTHSVGPGTGSSRGSIPCLSPRSPTSATTTDSKSALFTDIFNDEVFGAQADPATSPFTSPRLSGSPDLQSPLSNDDPEQLAKDDPLATQVWKMYARTKATLPHAQRMENLTWRMMALALKKKKEDEEAKLLAEWTGGNDDEPTEQQESSSKPAQQASGSAGSDEGNDERGRGRDKGKGRVRVVGFDGTNQDGVEDDEYVAQF